jgi:hypothetical protein
MAAASSDSFDNTKRVSERSDMSQKPIIETGLFNSIKAHQLASDLFKADGKRRVVKARQQGQITVYDLVKVDTASVKARLFGKVA